MDGKAVKAVLQHLERN